MGAYIRLIIQHTMQILSVRQEQSSDKEYIRTAQYAIYSAGNNVHQEWGSQF